MNATALTCLRCDTPLTVSFVNTGEFLPCPVCNVPLLIRAFPALVRPAQHGAASEPITDAGQAACFYHPHKTAHIPCDACGRFICALCDVELPGQHLCPSCVETGQRKGTLPTLENRRVLWDNIALSVAVLPVATLVLAGFSLFTAPAAILLAVISWRKPGSLVPREKKFRLLFAIAFALVTLAGWGVLFYFMATKADFFP